MIDRRLSSRNLQEHPHLSGQADRAVRAELILGMTLEASRNTLIDLGDAARAESISQQQVYERSGHKLTTSALPFSSISKAHSTPMIFAYVSVVVYISERP